MKRRWDSCCFFGDPRLSEQLLLRLLHLPKPGEQLVHEQPLLHGDVSGLGDILRDQSALVLR